MRVSDYEFEKHGRVGSNARPVVIRWFLVIYYSKIRFLYWWAVNGSGFEWEVAQSK